MTWRELTQRVEEAGLMDTTLACVHVLLDEPEDETCIDVFRNIGGTATIMNSTCR